MTMLRRKEVGFPELCRELPGGVRRTGKKTELVLEQPAEECGRVSAHVQAEQIAEGFCMRFFHLTGLRQDVGTGSF